MSAVFTLLVVGAFIMVNLLGDLLTDRFYLKLDMTREKLYEMSDETKQVLRGLNEQLTITVLANESAMETPPTQTLRPFLLSLRELLEKYGLFAGGHVTVQYADPVVNAALVAKYNENENLTPYSVIVSGDRRYKAIPFNDLGTAMTQRNQQTGYVENETVSMETEQALTSAILFVTADTLPRVVFLEGHKEQDAPELQALLTKANYTCDTVNLKTAELPADTALLVVNAPTVDFGAEETAKLDGYLQGGGYALVFVSYELPELPVLERYLSEWGIDIEKKLILDAQGGAQPYYVTPKIMPHESTTGLDNAPLAMLMMGNPFITDWIDGHKDARTVVPLLQTAESSYAKALTVLSEQTDLEKGADDEGGPFSMALLSEQVDYDDKGQQRKSGIFISSGALASAVLDRPDVLNNRFMSSLLSYLYPITKTVVIQPKEYDILSKTLDASVAGAAPLWLLMLIVVMPLAIVLIGFDTWRRRRRL